MSLSNPINPPLVNEAVAKPLSTGQVFGVDENQTKINQLHGITPNNASGAGIPKQVTNVQASLANASPGATSAVNIQFRIDPSDKAFSGVRIFAKGYQGNNTPVLVGSSTGCPATVILNNTGESVNLIVQAYGNGGVAPFNQCPSASIKLPFSKSGGAGSSTVTSGSAVLSGIVGQLTVIAPGATQVMGADLSGDVTTSGGKVCTVDGFQGTLIQSGTPLDGDVYRYSVADGEYKRVMMWDWIIGSAANTYWSWAPWITLTSPITGQPWTVAGTYAQVIAGTSTDPISSSYTCSLAAGVQSAGLIFQSNVTNCVWGQHRRVRFRVKLGQTTNTRIWMGYAQTLQTATTYQNDLPNTNIVAFRYSSGAGDTKYQCVTATSNTAVTINAESGSSHVDATSYHIFDVVYDGNTTVTFYIDGVLVATNTTHVPLTSTSMAPFIALDNVVTGNGSKFFLSYAKGTVSPIFM